MALNTGKSTSRLFRKNSSTWELDFAKVADATAHRTSWCSVEGLRRTIHPIFLQILLGELHMWGFNPIFVSTKHDHMSDLSDVNLKVVSLTSNLWYSDIIIALAITTGYSWHISTQRSNHNTKFDRSTQMGREDALRRKAADLSITKPEAAQTQKFSLKDIV